MTTQTTPQITDTDLERPAATELADGLRALAAMVESIPGHVGHFQFALSNVLAYVDDNAREVFADTIRATLAAGGKVDKYFSSDDKWAGALVSFGPVRIQIYAERAEVCERVVVGTREVTKQVPDPDALASVPTVTVTETVEDVKWVCTPLLAEATDDAQSGRAA